MTTNSSKFYNMMAHLIQNNRIYEENVAVKNIWQKDGNIFLDLYFYSRRKSYIFDAVFVHDIYDLSTEIAYRDMNEFLIAFTDANHEEHETDLITKDSNANKIVDFLKYELVILSFMANCCGYYSTLKKKIIIDYIIKQSQHGTKLSRHYLETYLQSITPEYDNFYQALQKLDYRNSKKIEILCKEVLKVCMADGRLHYTEKVYLAEMMQIMRDAGIKIDLGI